MLQNVVRSLILSRPQVSEVMNSEEYKEGPVDGIYVGGLYVDNARWNLEHMYLDEAAVGVMYTPLPVVHFVPISNYEPPAEEYQCPLYKTSVRAGILSTTGQSTNFVLCVSLPVRPGTNSDFWVLQGIALLCMLND